MIKNKRRLLRIFIVFCILSNVPALSFSQQYSPHMLIVKFKRKPAIKIDASKQTQRTGISSIDELFEEFHVKQITPLFNEISPKYSPFAWQHQKLGNVYKITLPESSDVHLALKAFSLNDHVEYAQFNHIYKIHALQRETEEYFQWALDVVNAKDAWEIEEGSPEVLVAIIDTGIEYDHPDLAENIWMNDAENMNGVDDDGNGFIDDIQGWDFTDAPFWIDDGDYLNRDNDPKDERGHGTSIAGIVAAVANDFGVTGLAPGCQIMNLRAGTSRGLLEEDDVASALAYAVDNGAHVVNMSFGDVVSSPLFRDAVRYAHACGVVLVASAGNSASMAVHYPSGFEEVISVGSTDSTDILSGFSNYGSTVDIVAPGTSIITTLLNSSYGRVDGTSASAPYVSALAALVISVHPDYSNENVQGVLLSSADDLGSTGWDRFYAAGRINAHHALRTNNYTVARILWPRLDLGFGGGEVPIIGTASGVYMQSYSLQYGAGDDPETWEVIPQVETAQVIEDTLGYWNIESIPDTSYMLRLNVQNNNGTEVNQTIRVFVDRTPPVISDVQFTPMIEDDGYATLLEFATDDICQTSVMYTTSWGSEKFIELRLPYESVTHRILLPATLFSGSARIKILATNRTGQMSIDDNQGLFYEVALSAQPVSSDNFVQVPQILEPAYLLNTAPDFDADGAPEMIVNEYTNSNGLSFLKIYEFENEEFTRVLDTEDFAIPRDVGDGDGDGLHEILAGFGSQSMIYEQTALNNLSFEVVWFNADNFWASRYADMNGDGKSEIIARIDDTFQVWENTGDNSYVFVDSLPNPTSGSNITGVPHVEIGDFDGDGSQEILMGDYDGDVYIYESSKGVSNTFTWSERLPLMDSIDFLSSGDYDGDGVKEFVVGCHSDPALDAEHEFDARHWLYRVYDTDGDNDYKVTGEWRFFGFSSPKDFDSGVSSGDIDADGRDEILLNVFPDFYIIDYDTFTMVYEAIWHYRPNRSNVTVVGDYDGNGVNEFYFNNGEQVIGFERLQASGGPPAPKVVSASPLDTSRIAVSWGAVDESDGYWIYFSTDQTTIQKKLWITDSEKIITNLLKDQKYFFAITTVDSSRQPVESALSRIVTATPNTQPGLESAMALSEIMLRVRFTENMSNSIKDPTKYTIAELLINPSSSLLDKSGREVVLTLPTAMLPEQRYTVLVNDVYDEMHTPIDTTRDSISFTTFEQIEPPYLKSAELRNTDTIILTFSTELDLHTAAEKTNYRLDPEMTIHSAEAIGRSVTLKVDPLIALGGDDSQYILFVSNVKSTDGIFIQAGRGDRVAISITRSDLSDVFTYPNPYTPDSGADGITFANLTATATIRIFTMNGIPIRRLEETDGNGGLHWDLRNENGELVAGGVYIFYITNGDDEKMGKLAIVR